MLSTIKQTKSENLSPGSVLKSLVDLLRQFGQRIGPDGKDEVLFFLAQRIDLAGLTVPQCRAGLAQQSFPELPVNDCSSK